MSAIRSNQGTKKLAIFKEHICHCWIVIRCKILKISCSVDQQAQAHTLIITTEVTKEKENQSLELLKVLL